MPALFSSTTTLACRVNPSGLLPQLQTTVQFIGRIPDGLPIDNTVPVQITISVPHEVGAHAYPILHIHRPSDEEGADSDVAGLPVSGEEEEAVRGLVKLTNPSFLPLPPAFRPSDSQCWIDLYQQIAVWTVNNIPDQDSSVWAWACDAYWIAFIAAHPDFPRGRWPSWDERFSLNDRFINKWLELRKDRIKGSVLSIVWEEMYARFRQHVSFLLV